MINDLLCKFTFHSVGQGLFYTGRLQTDKIDFNFVYDCGSDNRAPRIKSINNYTESVPKDQKIDLLVISHLHTDHYNGIKQLLKNRGAKLVILPFALPWERMVIKLTGKRSAWSDSFLENPATFLIEENGVDEVIYIDNSNPNAEHSVFIPEDFLPDPDFHGFKMKMLFKPNNDEVLNNTGKIKFAESGGVVIACDGKWFFSFYNNPLTKELRLQFERSLKSWGIDIADSKSIAELMSRSKRNKIASAYKQVFGEGDELNTTSLITVHGPCGNPQLCCKIKDKNHFACFNAPLFQMLTGDFSFPLWLDDFHNKNQRLVDKVSIASIPHHGSEYNWSNDVLTKIQTPFIWVASHATVNKHNHPASCVKTSIQQGGKIFRSVTENKDFEYGGFLVWN